MAKKLSTTPKGRAVFPRLTGEPDTKFNAAGVWSVKLTLSAAEAAPIVTVIDEAMKEALVEGKKKNLEAKAEHAALTSKAGKKPPKEIVASDPPYFVDEESGDVTLSFKMTASGVSKKDNKPFTQKPALFDASGTPIKSDIRIGGGSLIRVSYEITMFASSVAGAGVSLRLKAVQVIELVEFGGNSGYYGFESEEGGYAADPAAATAAKETFPADESASEAAASSTGSASDEF